MPRIKISVGDIRCIQQADRLGKDDVYWQANLRSGANLDPKYTDLAKLVVDGHRTTSLPEMVEIGSGEGKRFANNVIYDADCAFNEYVFGTVHFLERDTPLAFYFVKIVEVLAIVIGSLAGAALLGFAVGFGVGGWSAAFVGAVLAVAFVGLVGFFVGASIELMRPPRGDAHLGGMRIVVGPIAQPPPNSDKDAWPLTMIPSGRLDIVNADGAEVMVCESSHTLGHVAHRYETTVHLEVTGGHR